MKFTRLITDREGVSPVIGVILMVAITVILSAVIGTFVLGLGGAIQETAPQAQFSFEWESGASVSSSCNLSSSPPGTLTITHEGGDPIDGTLVDVTDGSASIGVDSCGVSGEMAAGSSAVVGTSEADTIRVTWTDESQNSKSTTATLAKWVGPDA